MPYGYGYAEDYEQGYAPFNPGYGAMAPWGGTYMGEPPPPAAAEKGYWEKTKDFMKDTAIDDIPNWSLFAGAAVVGTIWYGYSQGWFD
jgi:hypothetical protein